MATKSQPTDELVAEVAAASAAGKISATAAKNITAWLSEPRYAEYAPQVAEHITAGRWQQLDDVFWTVIPFGTGGRRGRMYPIGSNAINDRTMGESAQGLADYVKTERPTGDSFSCAIAYDTRHRSRHFAELCAEIMVAAGFEVYFLDGVRSTPELSSTVRHFRCSCGIMITASHNPPSDNAIKAYWSTGAQLLPPHDKGVIDRVMSVSTISRVPFADALAAGHVKYCQEEADKVYISGVAAQSISGPRALKILYSPMHGVGASSVCPALAAAGFTDVEVFRPQADPDGDFPNVPGHVANPENPATFDATIERAQQIGAEVILSSDPDADRLGLAAPATTALGAPWRIFTGNQIGALLAEYVLGGRRAAGTLSSDNYVVKTLVTSEMVRRIADSYGVKTYGNLLVGFKWIAQTIDAEGPERFVFACEESHGFLAGTHVRDKDAAVAAMLAAELAAQCKAAGQTLSEKLDALFWQHGCHAERTVSKTMPGSEGMAQMKSVMTRLRTKPPESLGGMRVVAARDYLNRVTMIPGSGTKPLDGPCDDLVIFDLERAGNYAAVRPSGTEPKVKFYNFAYEPAEQLANLEDTKAELEDRLTAIERDLAAVAEAT
jgi:phosphoglucomutase/phosphomannomutase